MMEFEQTPDPEEELSRLIRREIQIELENLDKEPNALKDFIEGRDDIETIARPVLKRLIKQGFDIDELDIVEAMLDEEDGDDGYYSTPDDPSDEGGSNDREPRNKPPTGGSGGIA